MSTVHYRFYALFSALEQTRRAFVTEVKVPTNTAFLSHVILNE